MVLKLYYKLTFDYDSQSRRIRKQVQTKTTFGGAWGGATSHLFVYDDWNLLLWVNGSVAKQGYHWLPDMSGTWQGAGGVRGLVGISYKDQGGAAYYWSLNVGYDGNGNVVGLYGDVGGSTGLYAVYEYDPFGNTIRQNVTPAGNSLATTLGENPFRFSTKFTDDESKLIFYGYRYYSAGLGRWLNRDFIEEGGGLNLYAFCLNNAAFQVDFLGLNTCKFKLCFLRDESMRELDARVVNSSQKVIDSAIAGLKMLLRRCIASKKCCCSSFDIVHKIMDTSKGEYAFLDLIGYDVQDQLAKELAFDKYLDSKQFDADCRVRVVLTNEPLKGGASTPTSPALGQTVTASPKFGQTTPPTTGGVILNSLGTSTFAHELGHVVGWLSPTNKPHSDDIKNLMHPRAFDDAAKTSPDVQWCEKVCKYVEKYGSKE